MFTTFWGWPARNALTFSTVQSIMRWRLLWEPQDKLRAYMLNYFSMMMAISSIFLTLDGSAEAMEKRRQLWADLKAHDARLYRRCRLSVAEACNLPGWLGSKLSIGGYRIAQKLFKFN